jgi:hypothetical protein
MTAHRIRDDHDTEVRTLETLAMVGASRLLANQDVAATFAKAMEHRIAATLPPGKTYAEALDLAKAFKDRLWSAFEWMLQPEDARIDELHRLCTSLCSGDAECGRELAERAVWS